MNATELERFLHREIPISRAMDLRVVGLESGAIRLAAPLAENRNDKGTAFGGSLASLLLLSGWGLLHAELLAAGFDADVVIHRSETRYQRPVRGAIEVSCTLPGHDTWARFEASLRQRGRARISLVSRVELAEGAAVTMSGHYVAMARRARETPT